MDGYEFMMVNTNKKSVAVDLKSEGGREIVRKLIAVSDVLVENYQKGTIEKFGLDYESVRKINPRLIYACSRGYGETGPYSPYGSNAGVNNGMSAWTHASWQYNGAPGTKPVGIGDEAGGISMAVGILAALHAREHTGKGQKIEISMQEAVFGIHGQHVPRTLYRQQDRLPTDPGERRLFHASATRDHRCELEETRSDNGARRLTGGSAVCHC